MSCSLPQIGVPLQLREGSGRDKEISTIATSTNGPPLPLVVIESGLMIMDGCRSPKTLYCTYPAKRKAWPSRRSNRGCLGHAPEAEGHVGGLLSVWGNKDKTGNDEVKLSHQCRHWPTLALPQRRSTLGIGKRGPGGLSNAGSGHFKTSKICLALTSPLTLLPPLLSPPHSVWT